MRAGVDVTSSDFQNGWRAKQQCCTKTTIIDMTKRRLRAPLINELLVLERNANGISCNRRARARRELYYSQIQCVRTVIMITRLHFREGRKLITNVLNNLRSVSMRE